MLYSVNVNTDELVQLDSDTGTVVNIGSLGFNALDVDLATVGNRLFALNSDFLNRVDLHELNPFTGAALSSNQVMLSASAVLNVKGLTQFSGQLKIGYSTAGNAASNGLGDLGLDGLITGGLSGSFDFDGLGENTASIGNRPPGSTSSPPNLPPCPSTYSKPPVPNSWPRETSFS